LKIQTWEAQKGFTRSLGKVSSLCSVSCTQHQKSLIVKKYSSKKRPKDTSISNPAITDLIEIWPKTIDQQDYAKQIFPKLKKQEKQQEKKPKLGTNQTSLIAIKRHRKRNFYQDKLFFIANFRLVQVQVAH